MVAIPGQARAVPALDCRHLAKRPGHTVAVDDISLAVPTGSLFGLVGPNGAGKTTTLLMATGLLRPDAGQAFIAGVDVWRDPTRAHALVGVLPDGMRTLDRLTGGELVEYTGRLHGLPTAEARRRTAELLAVLDLEGAGRAMVVDYSAGMRKKVGLACAMVHGPRLLVLDEPFEAVDPVSATTVRELLHRFVSQGGTVIISSHVMALVEQLCDYVGVIVKGRLVAAGTVDDVRGNHSLEEKFVELAGGAGHITQDLSWLTASR
jgi:ABC-2 type transport system ATP-binding protein